ncbi:zinc ribbon domain-containing protein [Thermogemmatispora sp.]|uniref:zinc ribbon domain-containing protein n=1 Tax=Thermogemmatispora sp. TaxID=1968838 RepID=UPI001D247645|nr:zinc ribbon domain-containing protein [Thermogemmatispora sp.]MBX5451917.1 zinc ribbon domain-containing protein [Thermogemmatispora sp.]
MSKPVTGQYECQRRSLPVPGLASLTTRVDRLILLPHGRFVLLTQERSRLAQAAQSLLAGTGASAGSALNQPPAETRHEGQYVCQDRRLLLLFDDGSRAEGQLAWNGEGVQLGPDFFQKVSDSTLFPSPQRLKEEMEELAKGLKIAATLGSLAVKAARAIHSSQATQPTPPGPSSPSPAASTLADSSASPAGPAFPVPAASSPVSHSSPDPAFPVAGAQAQAVAGNETFFCDQCGARVRPGKRYCGQCGALLP